MPELLQERWAHEGTWHCLVACVLMNRASGKAAESVAQAIFERYWSPDLVTPDARPWLEAATRPLGLWRVRAKRITDLSTAFVRNACGVRDLPGVGQYAYDSYRMFCLGDLSFEPLDKELKVRIIELRRGIE